MQMQQQEQATQQEDRPWLRMSSPDRIHLFNEYAMTLPDNLTTRQVQAAMLKRFPIW
jgi:hypothetical protein